MESLRNLPHGRLSIDLAFRELFVPDGCLMNSAPTARVAFPSGEASRLLNARGPTSVLGIPGYHCSCRRTQGAVAFRNVGRKPYGKGGTRQAGERERPPKLMSGGDFSNQSLQYSSFPEFSENVQFSFIRQVRFILQARKNSFKQASSCSTPKGKRKTIHFLASVLQWQVRTQGPCLQKELSLGWRAVN